MRVINNHQPIKDIYPEVIKLSDMPTVFRNVLQANLGINVDEILYFVSTCCYSNLLGVKIKDTAPWNIGGLGGFPFQGLSALKMANVDRPYEAVVVCYSTNIDIRSDDILLLKNSENITEIAAVNTAFNKLMDNKIIHDHVSDLDYQMNTIEQILYREQRRIKSSDYPLFESADVMYEAIDARLQLLLSKTKYNCKNIIMAGGVCISDLENNESYITFKRFDHIDTLTKEKTDCNQFFSGLAL